MSDHKEQKGSYLSQLMAFYFAPGLRSVATLIYLGIYGYFAIYYVDNFFLAIRFLFYTMSGHNALQETSYLFTGMLFVVSLILPFVVSLYSIFTLHKVWDRQSWASYAKWIVTVAVIVASILLIVASDRAARLTARQPAMQSFIEDANLTGKI